MIAKSNPDLKMFEDLAVNFAAKELTPAREENDTYPFGPYWTAIDQAWEVGFLGITLPEDLGGIGQGIGALSVILERLSRDDASLGGILLTHTLAQDLMINLGASSTLGDINNNAAASSDALLSTTTFSNPGELGKNAKAKKNGKGYTLEGPLEYLVLGGIAGHAVVPACIDGADEYSWFLVDLADESIKKSDPIVSLGLHCCPAVDVTFKATPATLLGEAGKGAAAFTAVADKLSVASAAISTGIMNGSFAEGFEYTQNREQGGQMIVNWTEIRMILGEMAMEAKTAELALDRAVQAVEREEDGWQMAARAACGRIQSVSCDLTTNGIQVLGGYGYMKDYGQEKRFRDAKHMQTAMGLAPVRRLRFIDSLLQ